MDDTQILKHLAKNANCSGVDIDVFFEPDNSRGAIVNNLPMLKKICGSCRVQKECLDYALRHDVQGVWAGTHHEERKRMRKHLGIKAEPVSFQLYVPKLKSHHHEDLLWKYIDNKTHCQNGHPINSPKDVMTTYLTASDGGQVPLFKCKACADAGNKRYREKVLALRTEPSRG